MQVQKHLSQLMQVSRQCFPKAGARALKQRSAFVAAGMRHKSLALALLNPPPDSALARIMAERPETIGALIWPYQSAAWSVETRLPRLIDHYAQVDHLPSLYHFGINDKLQIFDLSEQFEGLRIIVDQPVWFMREGGFTVNLFVGDFRAFSVAFSLFDAGDGARGIYLGGIQGRNRDDALDLYRALTKALYGLRPRDMALEMARLLGQSWGATRMICVADACRHHRHRFFGQSEFPLNYDQIWLDRGGQAINAQEFEVPLARTERNLDSLSSKKRALYRKRYGFLSGLDAAAAQGFPDAQIIQFKDT